MANQLHKTDLLEGRIHREICRREDITAREPAKCVPADKHRINSCLCGARNRGAAAGVRQRYAR